MNWVWDHTSPVLVTPLTLSRYLIWRGWAPRSTIQRQERVPSGLSSQVPRSAHGVLQDSKRSSLTQENCLAKLSPRTKSYSGKKDTTVATFTCPSLQRKSQLNSLVSQATIVNTRHDTNRKEGSPSIATHNAWEIPLANFTVFAGDNHIHRPKDGVQAESGALKSGEIKHTNLTLNTETGVWKVQGFDKMYLNPEPSFLGSS